MTLRMPALGRTITLAAAAALTGGFLAVTPASALDDGDQSFFETVKGLAGYAIGFGLGSSDEDEKPRIQYRERAPLVLPPNKGNLPPPAQGAGARNPNWPQDYDEGRRERANAADPMKRARLICDYIAGMTDTYAIDEHRRLFNLERWV